MKTLKIYKNYGCLGAEKRIIYTYGTEQPTAVCNDILTVKIPDNWDLYKNDSDELILLSPWGWTYTPNEVLAGNENPYFIAIDKDGKEHRQKLEIA